MWRKVRRALLDDVEKLGGIVEVDETFVGGLNKAEIVTQRGKGIRTARKMIFVGARR